MQEKEAEIERDPDLVAMTVNETSIESVSKSVNSIVSLPCYGLRMLSKHNGYMILYKNTCISLT